MRNWIEFILFLTFYILPLGESTTFTLEFQYTAVTPGTNFSEFTSVALLNGEEFLCYTSSTREVRPTIDWVKKIEEDDPSYLSRETEESQNLDGDFRKFLKSTVEPKNETKGIHTLQLLDGCRLDVSGSITQTDFDFALDGNRLLLNQATFANYKLDINFFKRCFKKIKMYVSYGRETLERKVPPKVQVFQQQHSSSPEVVCHATGFFPRAVNMTWQRDGEEMEEGVEIGEILPNVDRSFQKRIILKVLPKDLQKNKYTCVIQHSSLEKDLVLPVAVPDKGSDIKLVLISVCIGCILLIAVGIWWCYRSYRRRHFNVI